MGVEVDFRLVLPLARADSQQPVLPGRRAAKFARVRAELRASFPPARPDGGRASAGLSWRLLDYRSHHRPAAPTQAASAPARRAGHDVVPARTPSPPRRPVGGTGTRAAPTGPYRASSQHRASGQQPCLRPAPGPGPAPGRRLARCSGPATCSWAGAAPTQPSPVLAAARPCCGTAGRCVPPGRHRAGRHRAGRPGGLGRPRRADPR